MFSKETFFGIHGFLLLQGSFLRLGSPILSSVGILQSENHCSFRCPDLLVPPSFFFFFFSPFCPFTPNLFVTNKQRTVAPESSCYTQCVLKKGEVTPLAMEREQAEVANGLLK